MVDANAVVLLPGAGLVVPERVTAGPIASGPDRVGQSEMVENTEFLPRARQEQRVRHPAIPVTGIEPAGNDIEVAAQDQRLLQLHPFACIVDTSTPPSPCI